MLKFRLYRRLHVFFGYRSFFKVRGDDTTRVLIRGTTSNALAQWLLNEGYVEEWDI